MALKRFKITELGNSTKAAILDENVYFLSYLKVITVREQIIVFRNHHLLAKDYSEYNNVLSKSHIIHLVL